MNSGGGFGPHPFMRPEDTVITVITKAGNRSPLIDQMRRNGAEVWNNVMIRASYEGIKKFRPDAPYKDMKSIYGKHLGKTAFICGAGPSLNESPVKLPGPTFAINRAIKHVKADYWCFSDMKAMRDNGECENAKAAEWAFCSSLHVFIKDIPGYLIEANGNPLNYKIEKNRPLYFNGATFSWALHWAIMSGAKRIVCIGCEFSTCGKYFDGTGLSTTQQLGARLLSEIARLRVDDMFGEDKPHWYDPDVEILDASNGYLPVQKTRLEEWL